MRGLLLCAFAVIAGTAWGADQLYRYRDEHGQWQFTDRPPAAAASGVEVIARDSEGLAPRLLVQRVDGADGAGLQVVNELHCPVEVLIEIVQRDNVSDAVSEDLHWVVPARDQRRLVVPARTPGRAVSFRYRYAYVLGDPQAEHAPPLPYRAPFALAQSFKVTQGFHGTASHASPANEYAIDIAMPVGTGVYAAREGVVVEIAYANFAGGRDAEVDGPRANIVRIAHDDGTFGLYAHLDRASVRVRPGERVRAGQYIADSGNTGFTSGPHLHFAVLKNRGFELASVPFAFRGAEGTAVAPAAGEPLTAYP
jgi:murein DD-endopeptidase MepM/ murein hydrolase activator NlpD